MGGQQGRRNHIHRWNRVELHPVSSGIVSAVQNMEDVKGLKKRKGARGEAEEQHSLAGHSETPVSFSLHLTSS